MDNKKISPYASSSNSTADSDTKKKSSTHSSGNKSPLASLISHGATSPSAGSTSSTKPGTRSGSRNGTQKIAIVTPHSNNSSNSSPYSSVVKPSTSGEKETKLTLKSMYPKGMDEALTKTVTPAKPLSNGSNTANFVVSSSSAPPKNAITKSAASLSRSKAFRAGVEKAMREKKVFSVVGVYPAVKNALRKRGWVEKPGPLTFSRSLQANMTNTILSKENDSLKDEESDAMWASRVLKDYPPDFIWVIRRDNIDWKSLGKEQMINRYPKAYFTTKVGLAQCLLNLHWYSESDVADTFFPRCYRICTEDEKSAFIEDYRLTACVSFLKYIVDAYETRGGAALIDTHSKITPLSIDFAARQLSNHVRMRRHEDIDWNSSPTHMNNHWEAFISQYYAVVHHKRKMNFESPDAVRVKYETAKRALLKISAVLPQYKLDGMLNIWICKPGARSRGKGIVIMNQLEKILDLLGHASIRESNWVVQKYIERPLLIYKTKFDIRQWFVITDWMPLTVWFYKESYVRFCSKPFTLEDFHESIHLSNNAVQCHYQNSDQRDPALPDENMWDCYTFQSFLKTQGKLDAWPSIYSGMKQAIIGVLLTSQESTESRKSCFELYGADFMLTEDYRPWLIEINSCPCMAPSTSITARMCAQCLEDTIKVVIDRRKNKNADTGMFELVYKQNESAIQVHQYNIHDLTIHGRKVPKDGEWSRPSNTTSSVATKKSSLQRNKSAGISNAPTTGNAITPSQPIGNPTRSPENSLTFSDLLQKLRTKNGIAYTDFIAHNKHQLALLSRKPTILDSSSSPPWGKTLESGNNSNLAKNSAVVYPEIGNLKNVLPTNGMGVRSGAPALTYPSILSMQTNAMLSAALEHSSKGPPSSKNTKPKIAGDIDDVNDNMKSSPKKISTRKVSTAGPQFDTNKATEQLLRLSQEAAQAAFNRAKAQGALTPPSAHFSQVYMIYPSPPEHNHELLEQQSSSSSDSDILEPEKVQVLEPSTPTTTSTNEQCKHDSSVSSTPEMVEPSLSSRSCGSFRSERSREYELERRSFLSTPVDPENILSNTILEETYSDELIRRGNGDDDNNNNTRAETPNVFPPLCVQQKQGNCEDDDDGNESDEINVNNYFTPYVVRHSSECKEDSVANTKGVLRRKSSFNRVSCPKNMCYKMTLQRSRSRSLSTIWRANGPVLPLKKVNIML